MIFETDLSADALDKSNEQTSRANNKNGIYVIFLDGDVQKTSKRNSRPPVDIEYGSSEKIIHVRIDEMFLPCGFANKHFIENTSQRAN